MESPRHQGVSLWFRRFTWGATAALALTLAVSFAASTPAESRGRKPEDVFKGKIVLSTKPYPFKFKNDGAFINYVKKVKKTEFYPEKEEGSWQIHYMAFFHRPLERRDYSVLFYDITDKSRPRFVMEGASYPEKAGERIMVGEYELQRMNFEEDKKYLMTYSLGQGQAALAEVIFILRPYDAAKSAAIKKSRAEQERKEKAEKKRIADEKKDKKNLKWEPPNW